MTRPPAAAPPLDLLILGSGSTAFSAAIRAADLGARIAMVERRTLGGTCANRGCLPSKNLIEAARMVHDAAHPRYPGLAAATVAVDDGALIEQKDDVVRAYRAKKYASVADGIEGLEVIVGDASFVDERTVTVGDRRVSADRILIATGSRPAIPDIPGLADTPYWTSDLLDADEAERMRSLPASIVLIGGGTVAVELAQMLRRLGSEVTVVARGSLLPRHEPEIGRTLAEALGAEGIELILGSRIDRVSGDARSVTVRVEDRAAGRIVRAERLVVAAGRSPNTETLGLDRAGAKADGAGHVTVNAQLRSSVDHIWAAGDVIGRQHGSHFATPVGARQGRIVADNAFADARRSFDGTVVPRAIFVDPPIATVGLTEAEVTRRRTPAVATTTPLEFVPRAGAIHRPQGFVKFVASTIDERVLGVHMIGEAAPEIIHEAAMAMKFRATLADFVDLIHVYPTMSEALKIGAQAFSRDVTKLSCCAE